MPIDIHAHYVPPQLIAAIKSKGGTIGVRLMPADGGKEALGFDYGFKVRPFFPRLVETVAERHKWMDEQGSTIRSSAPGRTSSGTACRATHASPGTKCSTTRWRNGPPTMPSDFPGSRRCRSPTPSRRGRTGTLRPTGAVGVIISSNIENVNLGEFPLDPFWRKAEALGLPILIHPVNVALPRERKNSRSPRSRSTPMTPRSALARC